jgi:hypothetical protein
MLNFPLNPTNGLTYSIDDHVWSWNGYAWEKLTQSGSGVTGPTGPTGPAGSDGGGTTLAAGAGMTLSAISAGVGHTLGIDPTAIVHVAGISSDGGITASDRISTDVFGAVGAATFIEMDRGGGGAGTIGFNPGGNFSTLFTPSLMYSGGNISIGGTSTLTGLVTASSGISSDGGATFGGDINLLDNQLERPKFKDYAETVNVIGTVTSDTVVDVSDGNVQTVTVGGDCEFTFTNFPASGIAGTCTLIITNGGAHATTWANHGSHLVRWPGDVAPALTASGIDILSFITINGGNRIDGFVGGINFL